MMNKQLYVHLYEDLSMHSFHPAQLKDVNDRSMYSFFSLNILQIVLFLDQVRCFQHAQVRCMDEL